MMNKDIKEKIIKIFKEHGVSVYEEDEIIDMDSLIYISIIVEIEKEFEIIIPDQFLTSEKLNTISEFEMMINSIQ